MPTDAQIFRERWFRREIRPYNRPRQAGTLNSRFERLLGLQLMRRLEHDLKTAARHCHSDKVTI
jgi:hypothetical protein